MVQKIFTVRKRSCAKVMFLHLSVILFTGVGVSASGSTGCTSTWQTPPPSGRPPQADTPIGRHPPSQTHTSPGRHPLGQTSLPGKHTPSPDTATAVDGTHPTGMHSCYKIFMLIDQNVRASTLEIVFSILDYHPNTSACNTHN